MALMNGKECFEIFKWILTRCSSVPTTAAAIIVVVIDTLNGGLKDANRLKKCIDGCGCECGTQSDYQTNDVLFIISTEKLPLLFRR